MEKEPIELNCVGLKCPRPIIEIAKLARKSPPETVVRITADDLAFESDIRAWCETTGATLVNLSKIDKTCVATVELSKKG
jgi:tRNA 2-thiouridine synthesizing protein A